MAGGSPPSHLVIPDPHALPQFNNRRADFVGDLIADLSPSVVVCLGDLYDMESLSSYDKGKRAFHGRTYGNDIAAGLEFQDRLWHRVKRRKKKLPRRVILEGNHENRIEKALDASPELQATIGFQDFGFDDYWDTVVRYSGLHPGHICLDGVHYAHYFVSGVKGMPISGAHHAYSLGVKRHVSSTVGHTHSFDYNIQHTPNGPIQSLVAGWFGDFTSPWAGQSQGMWWGGVVFKRGVENGSYDPQIISMRQLQATYGRK